MPALRPVQSEANDRTAWTTTRHIANTAFSAHRSGYAGPHNIRDATGRDDGDAYLEIVTSFSAEEFLLAFRRFIARPGKPSNMYSDNGTNSRPREKQLKDNNNKNN